MHAIGHTCTGSCICTKDDFSNVVENQECPVKSLTGWVSSAAFSPDGQRVVVASHKDSNLVKVWDVAAAAEVGGWDLGVRRERVLY